jgi:hypothetical protein
LTIKRTYFLRIFLTLEADMKKFSFLLILLLTAVFSGFSQTVDDDYYFPEEKEFKLNRKSSPRVGFMTGASIASFGRGNHFSTTFFAPNISYSLSPRINISAAAVISNSGFPGEMSGAMNNRFNGQSFSMGLEYRITQNFSIGGSLHYSNGPGAGFGNSVFGNPFFPGFSPMFPR